MGWKNVINRKHKARNPKSETKSNDQYSVPYIGWDTACMTIQPMSAKKFDLEERTFAFADAVRVFVRSAPRSLANIEYAKQVIRSSASVGANYIEANEALSKKDFLMRIRICRKEAKESAFFLRLLEITDQDQRKNLAEEAYALTRIFAAILIKSTADQ